MNDIKWSTIGNTNNSFFKGMGGGGHGGGGGGKFYFSTKKWSIFCTQMILQKTFVAIILMQKIDQFFNK